MGSGTLAPTRGDHATGGKELARRLSLGQQPSRFESAGESVQSGVYPSCLSDF